MKSRQPNFKYYQIATGCTSINGSFSCSAEVRKQCLNCRQTRLMPEYKYCPNCGIKFNEEINEK